MTIGIIGAGAIGSNIARLFAKNGIAATIANSRGPESLAPLIAELGPTIKAGGKAEAASADIVLVAVRWLDVENALAGLPAWDGRIVVDTTNPVEFLDPDSPEAKDPNNPLAAYGIRVVDLGGRNSSERIAELTPGARVVKAFNHTIAELLPAPSLAGGRRALFYSGDDPQAKAVVRAIIEQTGHSAVDLGGLAVGGPLTSPPLGALSIDTFIKAELAA